MFFIWHKKGYLVPIALLSGIVIEFILFGVGYAMKQSNPVRRILGIVSRIVLFEPALANYLFSKFFIDDEEIHEVKKSGNKMILVKDYSTFFSLRNRTWTRIFFYGVIVTLIYVLLLELLGWVNPH